MTFGPLSYRFRVQCQAERAFQLWTGSAGVWWPMATYSVSGRRDAVLVIEPGGGGRIYEQTADGQEFTWGTVVAWEPPARLVCEWLVGDTPTELEVRFTTDADSGTVVEIEHRGWERFGEVGRDCRDQNALGLSGGMVRGGMDSGACPRPCAVPGRRLAAPRLATGRSR